MSIAFLAASVWRSAPYVTGRGAAASRCRGRGPGVLAIALLFSATVHGQVAPAPAPQQPPPTVDPAPGAQQPAPPGTVVPAPTVAAAPLGGRVFLGQTGVIFNAVRPERVVDFEMVIGFLQAALAKSTNPQVQAQAKGWRMFKAVEPGPNATVLYVFWIDPAVPDADYALGPILSDAFPDQVEEIWKLYQGALVGGGSLLNLVTVEPPPLPPIGTPIVPSTPEPVRPPPPAGTSPAVTPPAAQSPAAPSPATTAP